MIEYKEFGSELIDEVYRIYQESQWNEYLKDRDRLVRAFDRSQYILGAFDEGKLVGFVRCVGDSEFILYVQDLVVKPLYQRQGIGRELMRRTSEKYPDARQFLLITDENDEVSNAFYQSIGLTKDLGEYAISHYFRRLKKE